MAHIPEQLIKINKNIQEAEVILSDLKKRTKTENVAEQIEHFESMLNKLNNLKESYIQLSAQYEATNDTPNSLIKGINCYDGMSGISSSNPGSVLNIRNALSAVDQLEQLKGERDRLKKELQDRQTNDAENPLTSSLEIDTTLNSRAFSPDNSFNDLVSDLHNFTGLDLSFYISVLDHHIEIGTKMVDMVDGLNLSDNLAQGIHLLMEVIQRLTELRERFQCVKTTKETMENQSGGNEDMLEREMDAFNSISEDLKSNFTTGVKCFKSAMDIIQSYLDPDFAQVDDARVDESEGYCGFGGKLNESSCNGEGSLDANGDTTSTAVHNSKNNNNNSESASEDHNNRSNEDDNNDGGDEDSDDSCREKDQDESMEVGVGLGALESMNEHVDQEAMHHLRLQTEFEQKEILRLLEEKRVMLKKLAELKRAKEIAKNQVLGLAQSGNMFGDLSEFLSSSQCNDLDDEDNDEELHSNSPRPDPMPHRSGVIAKEIGSLLKMFSSFKTDGDCEDAHQGSSSRMSSKLSIEPGNTGSRLQYPFSSQDNVLLPQLNDKAEELKQKQSQIQKLQEMLDQIKNDSISLNESIIRDSNDDYHSDNTNERDMASNGRPGKGRDSVTFQEPVATFIANEELYENMREVRMRREELRDRSARNSNSDPRSPSGLVIDSGNAPGAPPDAPVRMVVSSHETASQDRTTVATWGSSSAGGDDYDDHHHSGHNQLNSENLRIRSQGNRATALSSGNDERSRVAPIGQSSSSFRGKVRDSSYLSSGQQQQQQQTQQQQQQQHHQGGSLGPGQDLGSLKGQIENIATLCRNMAVEQSRLARDIADLKSGSSPRQPDLVMHPSPWNGAAKQHEDSHWSSPGQATTAPAVAGPTRQVPAAVVGGGGGHQDPGWDELSLASSTAQLHQQQQRQAAWYGPQMNVGLGMSPGYQQLMQQQSILMQNHAMFIKMHMSLVAAQLEQQRLCALALQQQQQQPGHHSSLYGTNLGPYYPSLTGPGHQSIADQSALLGCMPPPSLTSYLDTDCGLYSLYPPDISADTPNNINHHSTIPSNGAPLWKNSFGPARNVHRN